MAKLEAKNGKKLEADGYKLRMIFNDWYLLLYYKGKDTGFQLGPLTYNEAMEQAGLLQLTNIEKGI